MDNYNKLANQINLLMDDVAKLKAEVALLRADKGVTHRKGYINIYPGGIITHINQTRKSADDSQLDNRLACVEVEWDE